ncbi:MAG: DUF502 domain-containing protein [Planctomycetota bacterium]|nr:DUF502 domain-containing protein [Planctomycetota bacterium]
MLRRNLITGLLVLVPLGTTLWLAVKIWQWLNAPIYRFFALFAEAQTAPPDDILAAAVRWLLAQGIDLSAGAKIPGLGLLVTIIFIFGVGLIARTLVGRSLISLGERIVRRVPVLGSLYAAVQQALAAILSGATGSFREVVLIEYPRPGIWTIAFRTNQVGAELPTPFAQGAGTMIYCLVPTSPFPTNGFIVVVPADKAIPLGLSAEEAIKLIVSAGMVVPQMPRVPSPAAAVRS